MYENSAFVILFYHFVKSIVVFGLNVIYWPHAFRNEEHK